jgi:hypothetical protein
MFHSPIDPALAQRIFDTGVQQGVEYALDPETRLQQLFPRLVPGSYRCISPPDTHYNCVAWAVGKRDRHWWPNEPGRSYWPPGILAEASVDAFTQLFQSFGYEVCDTPDFQRRYEKVAIFVNNNAVTHAARQLGNGKWSSKLGRVWETVEHELEAVGGHGIQEYGDILQFMRRKRTLSRMLLEHVYYLAGSRLNLP